MPKSEQFVTLEIQLEEHPLEVIDYSVIIRTTGKAKEKYAGLLSSISLLSPQPKEVIVVLPEGYSLPEDRLGWETFYFCPKGMVIQRMTGIRNCKTRYALICDDDVRFESDFVQKLYKPVFEGRCGLSAAPLYSFLPQKGVRAFADAIMARALPTVFHKNNRYISVLKSAGYSYNRLLQSGVNAYYETQSVAWTCFFADLEVLNSTDFHVETWLDSHGYSAMDDQTMFYKAWLRGHKTIVVADAHYDHLDGRTSRQNNAPAVLYSIPFNMIVFWHRFIYSLQPTGVKKVVSQVAFGYRLLWCHLWDLLSLIRKKTDQNDFIITQQGYRDAWEYIKSDAYKALPSVIKEHTQ